jgi:hypothetical protein
MRAGVGTLPLERGSAVRKLPATKSTAPSRGSMAHGYRPDPGSRDGFVTVDP